MSVLAAALIAFAVCAAVAAVPVCGALKLAAVVKRRHH